MTTEACQDQGTNSGGSGEVEKSIKRLPQLGGFEDSLNVGKGKGLGGKSAWDRKKVVVEFKSAEITSFFATGVYL